MAGPVTMDKDPLETSSHLQSEPKVLEPELQQESSDLKEECQEFVDSKYRRDYSLFKLLWHHRILQNHRYLLCFAEISQYQKIVEGLIEVKDEMTKEVETEKMKV